MAVTADVTDAEAVAAAMAGAALAFGGVDLVVNNAGLSISKPLLETTEHDWDLQHDVMAKGSFLVSREAARLMRAQGIGGDIVYISSKNSAVRRPQQRGVRRGQGRPGAPGAAARRRAGRATASGSTAINPDGVVRGSGIFAGGWGAQRAAVYGVPEEELGAYYAQRTLLEARGAARTRRQRGVRAHRRRPVPHHRAAHPGRRRRRRGLPAVDAPCVRTPTSRRSTWVPPAAGSCSATRAAGRAGPAPRSHRFANRPGPAAGTLHWDMLAPVRRGRWTGIRAAARAAGTAATASASTPGRSTTGCSTRDGALLGNPVHYRDAPHRRGDGHGRRAGPGADGCTPATGLQHLPFNTIYQLAAARGTAALPRRRTAAADPRPGQLLADRRASAPSSPTPPRPGCSTSAPGLVDRT